MIYLLLIRPLVIVEVFNQLIFLISKWGSIVLLNIAFRSMLKVKLQKFLQYTNDFIASDSNRLNSFDQSLRYRSKIIRNEGWYLQKCNLTYVRHMTLRVSNLGLWVAKNQWLPILFTKRWMVTYNNHTKLEIPWIHEFSISLRQLHILYLPLLSLFPIYRPLLLVLFSVFSCYLDVNYDVMVLSLFPIRQLYVNPNTSGSCLLEF